jgi:thermitase
MKLRGLFLLVALSAALLLLGTPPRSSAQSNIGDTIALPFVMNNSPSINPDDPFYQSNQWNLQQLDLPHAWYYSTGSASVSVAVLDTGVDVQHPELAGRVAPGVAFVNPGTCPAQGVAYDDDDGHGTHVAGIVGARGNNGEGVAGMAWNTRILPVKVLSCTGSGTIADVVDGIYWAVDNGADVINLSLGWACSSNESPTQTAIDYAHERGVVVVAAAGNYANQSIQNVRNPVICPAALDHVISVGATTINSTIASYSTHNEFVDIAAPGASRP